MEKTVRAACPQCKTVLRIPTDWVGRTMRCKSCGATVRTRPRREAGASATITAAPVPIDQSNAAPNGVRMTVPPQPPGGLPVHVLPPVGAPPLIVPEPLLVDPQLVPLPVGDGLTLDPEADDPPVIASRHYSRRRGRGLGNLFWIGICILLAGGMVAGGISLVKHLAEKNGKQEQAGDKTDGKADGDNPAAQKAGAFPRRLLFISVTKYMYLNPLTATKDGNDQSKPAAQRIAFDWRVPTDKNNNQVFILTDSAADATILMKDVLMGAYQRFFETSRDQDRVVIYFGGHAIEKDGRAYLAPVEGEIEGDGWQQSLIPLDEFYGKLKDCKAGQKVMIWDVCRFNPQRGKQRPGSDPMSVALHKALTEAPAGIEVIISCSPGENALEFSKFQPDPTNRTTYGGSVFLEAVRYVGEKSKAAKPPTPADGLPVAEWAQAVAKRVAEIAALSKDDTKQTVKLDGKPRDEPVAYDAEEPTAPRFEMPVAPKGTSVREIKAIEGEFLLPAIRSDLTDTGLSDLPYLESAMKNYKADVPPEAVLKDREKYPLRVATLAAFDAIREVWGGKFGSEGIGNLKAIPAPITETLKKEILRDLEAYAVGIAKLELVDDELQKVAALRAGESRRWQAHYDYARAVVKARLAYLHEYNKLMGDVRTETLPELDKKIGQDSYRLASSEKMKSKKEIQKLAEDAHDAFARIVAEHRGTPWALQAKRDRSFSLGLVWQPFVSESAASSQQ